MQRLDLRYSSFKVLNGAHGHSHALPHLSLREAELFAKRYQIINGHGCFSPHSILSLEHPGEGSASPGLRLPANGDADHHPPDPDFKGEPHGFLLLVHRPLATGKICISKTRALVNSYTRILHKIFWREFYALSRPDNAPGGFFHFQVLAFWYWAGDVSMIQLPRMAVNGRYRLFQVPAFKLALIAGRWRSRTAVAVLRYHRSAHGQ